jgi:hypothetical protein
MTCRQNHFYNSTTGICTICPARTAGLDDPGVRLDGYDDNAYIDGGVVNRTFNNRCKYIFENIPPGEPSTNTQWCQILPTAKNVGGTVLTRLNPTTWACTSTCTAGYFKSATRLEPGEIDIGALTAPRAVTNQPTNLTGPANFTISMDFTFQNAPWNWTDILQNVTGDTWPLGENRKPLIHVAGWYSGHIAKSVVMSLNSLPGAPFWWGDNNYWVDSGSNNGWTFTPGVKFNFTATHDAATATIAVYIDGVKKNEWVANRAMVYSPTNTFTWRPSAWNLDGYVKVNNAYWINRVLTSTEITNIASGVSRECDMCATGYRWTGTACVACGTNMTTPPGPASGAARAACVCQTGYTGTDCMTCATNYTWNGRACVACQNGSTIASGPASGNARSCACPSGTWGSTCTLCLEPDANKLEYVRAVCTSTTNTDIVQRICAWDIRFYGFIYYEYAKGYSAGNSSTVGSPGVCTACTNPVPSTNQYIQQLCTRTSDTVIGTKTCASNEHLQGFFQGYFYRTNYQPAIGNPGTCILSCYGEGLADRSMPCCPGLFYDDGRCSS